MKILFVHQNFPGQFKFVAPALAAQGHDVCAFSMRSNSPAEWKGVRIVPYQADRDTPANVHRWVSDFETKTICAEAAFRTALRLRGEGYTPDAIVAHPGWGESLFLKDVWPTAKLGIYCEFFYQAEGADVGYDPEFPVQDPSDACRLRLKNINSLLHFDIADAGLSPTHWQASTFPGRFRHKITVVHDGIDTELVTPNPDVRVTLDERIALSREDEVITFVNRDLEPYRGYHIFMRALPQIMESRPKARVLIVGGDDVSYGPRPAQGLTWKDIFFDEVKSRIDPGRIHFLGRVPYQHFIALLQLSSVHVYLTYPFVLSWSLLEAMSAGCAIVASDTQPVCEAIRHDESGQLVNFFDPERLAEAVSTLLENPAERARLGVSARAFACDTYDLKSVCLPRQIQWVRKLLDQ